MQAVLVGIAVAQGQDFRENFEEIKRYIAKTTECTATKPTALASTARFLSSVKRRGFLNLIKVAHPFSPTKYDFPMYYLVT